MTSLVPDLARTQAARLVVPALLAVACCLLFTCSPAVAENRSILPVENSAATTEADMKALKSFASRKLKLLPEQVQIFTPTPSTYSTLMYWTEKDPFTGKPITVEKTVKGRQRQKSILAPPRKKPA